MPQEKKGTCWRCLQGLWSLFARSGAHRWEWAGLCGEVMMCGEQAENTLHSQPHAREKSRVQKSQRETAGEVRCCGNWEKK